jgi:hypothetical protein
MKYDQFTRWCEYFTTELQTRYGGPYEDALRRATALLKQLDGRAPRNHSQPVATRLRRRRSTV